MQAIDLDKLKGMLVYDVLEEYCKFNNKSIQDIETLDTFLNILNRLKDCLEKCDFLTAGPLVHLGHIMLRIESEKLLLSGLSEEQRAEFLKGKSKLYRMEAENAIQRAVLSLLSRSKEKIIVQPKENLGSKKINLGVLNRRRATTAEDVRSIVSDESVFTQIREFREQSAHLKEESVATTMIPDFDIKALMARLKGQMGDRGEVFLHELDMDGLDAFMAALHLAQAGEISISQEEFGEPIRLFK